MLKTQFKFKFFLRSNPLRKEKHTIKPNVVWQNVFYIIEEADERRWRRSEEIVEKFERIRNGFDELSLWNYLEDLTQESFLKKLKQ